MKDTRTREMEALPPYERYEEVRGFQKGIGNYWLLEKDSKRGERETILDSKGNIIELENCYK